MVFKSIVRDNTACFCRIHRRVVYFNDFTYNILRMRYTNLIMQYSIRIIFNNRKPTLILFDCVRNQNEVLNLLRVRKAANDEEKIKI